jgi:beta-N-acetylhexosaminidase
MYEIGATTDTANAYNVGNTIGAYLKEYGFNLDLAPVTDIVTTLESSFMGKRSYGADATVVAAMVSSEVQGLTDAGISSCLKHFPGQGNASVDPATAYSVVDRSYDEMMALEFIPFIEGIEAGAEFVMMSHVAAPQIVGDSTPCSLSKVMITDVLRGDLGFDGIVITDAMNKIAITEYYTTEEAVVNAVEAGADMILLPDNFEVAYQALLSAVQNGTITEDRINESLKRIYKVKYKDYL